MDPNVNLRDSILNRQQSDEEVVDNIGLTNTQLGSRYQDPSQRRRQRAAQQQEQVIACQ